MITGHCIRVNTKRKPALKKINFFFVTFSFFQRLTNRREENEVAAKELDLNRLAVANPGMKKRGRPQKKKKAKGLRVKMDKTDEVLIAEYQLGNKDALEELFQRYKDAILNFAVRIVGNRADAEDVTSEVFMVLFMKKNLYKPIAKFKTWIFKVAHNACMNVFRKQKRLTSLWFNKREEGDYGQWDIADENDIPSEILRKKEEGQAVRNAIRKLPDNQREALILREYHQMDYYQISEVMNCSIENIKILIYRARKELKNTLAL